MSVDAGPGGRCNARRRAREPFARAARALSVVRLRGARTRLQIRVREGEYVTFVRILTLMYGSASISAGRAAIFVTVYRGAALNHQGGSSAATLLVRSGNGRLRLASSQRDRCTWGCKRPRPRHRALRGSGAQMA